MSQIKLAIVMPHHWDSAMGGAEYQAKCLVDAMPLGDEFELCFIGRNVPTESAQRSYRVVGVRSRSRLAKYAHCFDAAQLRQALTEYRPDVIYQRVANSYTGIVARTAQDIGAKSVWHISSDKDVSPLTIKKPLRAPLDWIENRLTRVGIREVDAIIAQTPQQQTLLKQHYGRDVDLIVNNFHPPVTESLEKSSERIEVLWVSNLKPLKQPELFVSLAERLSREPSIRLSMIGAQQCDEQTYQQLLSRIDALPNIRYLGACSQAEVNAHIAASHVFVNTSEYEGFPNTFIQSWLRRVPTLSLNVDLDGLLAREGLGICCHSLDKLADTILELGQDPGRLAPMGQVAQDYALEHHSIQNAQTIMQLFKELANQP